MTEKEKKENMDKNEMMNKAGLLKEEGIKKNETEADVAFETMADEQMEQVVGGYRDKSLGWTPLV